MLIVAALEMAVAASSVVGGVIILSRRRRGALALGMLLILLAIHVAVLFCQELGWMGRHVTAAHLAGLLYGPLFYTYVRTCLFATAPRPWSVLPHAIPVLVFAAALAAGTLSGEALAFAVFASLGTYLGLAATQLHAYRHVLEATHSSLPSAQLTWLLFATGGLALIYLLDVAAFVAPRLFPESNASSHAVVLYLLMLAYLWALLLTALWRPECLAAVTEEEVLVAQTAEPSQATQATQALQTAQDAADLERIEAYMREQRPYLQPDLKLAALAHAVGLQPRRLSVLINRGKGHNFCEWVNTYRIEEARRLLGGGALRQNSVLEVMYRAGFNSKSTFNAAFRRATGTTPSEFVTPPGPKSAS